MVFCIFYTIVMIDNSYTHEQIHSEIARHHGCINSTIKINFFKDSYFKCYEYTPRSQDVVLDEVNLHSLNEIVTYNLHSLINIIILCILFIVVFFKSK